MANATEAPGDPTETGTTKPGRKALLLGLAGALVLGGGAFYAVWSGLILAPRPAAPVAETTAPDFAFVPIDQITISLLPESGARHLRFSAQIEVAAQSVPLVEQMRPRLLDMMNLYLRAVEPADLTDPAAMVRLRAQLLRRVQLMLGAEHVRDVLITEFVLS